MRSRLPREILVSASYDYACDAVVLLTLATSGRACILGDVQHHDVALTPAGALARQALLALPAAPALELDCWVVMPNHVHAIFAWRGQPTPPLDVLVRRFHAETSRAINQLRSTPGARVWARGFSQRALRRENDLDIARAAISTNPSRWWEDEHNPQRARR